MTVPSPPFPEAPGPVFVGPLDGIDVAVFMFLGTTKTVRCLSYPNEQIYSEVVQNGELTNA